MERIASTKIRTGFFIIADISGYTSFLTDTELEHAQEIIEEIIRLLLDHIKPPLKIVQLEGDAVFYYVPEEMLPEPERLLEHIEACYCDFVSHIHYARRLTHCGCRACSSMHTLDLKFFVHYAEYMIQKVPGTSEGVAGRDIILLHRLLKNSVTEKTGLRWLCTNDKCVFGSDSACRHPSQRILKPMSTLVKSTVAFMTCKLMSTRCVT
jgi:hypothetical protein